MSLKYEPVIDGCPCPRPLYPILKKLKKETGCTYASIYRGTDAEALLNRYGKHSQAYLYAHQGTEGIGPANPPGQSTHELRSDGVPYAGPVGRKLVWWQCGIDVDDAHVEALIAAAKRHGWKLYRPYGSGSEYHHVNFSEKPSRWKAFFHHVFGPKRPKPVTRVADAKPAKKPHRVPPTEGSHVVKLHVKKPTKAPVPNKVYDSTTVTEIPKTARAALGYVGGSWPTFENGELRKHLPHARLVSVAVSSSHDADMLDVETGDATPADCPGWFHRQQARKPKTRPKFYGSASIIDEIAAALDAAGVHRSQYVLLAAHYGAGKHVCGPKSCGLSKHICDGTQFTDTALGRNLDESYVKPSFWR
jgi:hypothetical protein